MIPLKMPTVRQRFFAGVGLYLAWVGFLVVLALTSAIGPHSGPVEDGPIRIESETPENTPAPTGTVPVR